MNTATPRLSSIGAPSRELGVASQFSPITQHPADLNESFFQEAILSAADSFPEFMTVAQVAKTLQVSCNTVRSLLYQRLIPGVKLSHKWVIPREALVKALLSK